MDKTNMLSSPRPLFFRSEYSQRRQMKATSGRAMKTEGLIIMVASQRLRWKRIKR
jgi:hypothetical protein